jgi:hypothetical protein
MEVMIEYERVRRWASVVIFSTPCAKPEMANSLPQPLP